MNVPNGTLLSVFQYVKGSLGCVVASPTAPVDIYSIPWSRDAWRSGCLRLLSTLGEHFLVYQLYPHVN